jgi:hypothetical protein
MKKSFLCFMLLWLAEGAMARDFSVGESALMGDYESRFSVLRGVQSMVEEYTTLMSNSSQFEQMDALAEQGKKNVLIGNLEHAYGWEYYTLSFNYPKPEFLFMYGDLGLRFRWQIMRPTPKTSRTCVASHAFAWHTRKLLLGTFDQGFYLAEQAGPSRLFNSTLYKSAKQEATCFAKLIDQYTKEGAPSCVPVEKVRGCLSEKPLATMYPLEYSK